jgi:hypothetical protein
MTRIVTSLFLAVLLADIASAVHTTTQGDTHQPPHGIRRMIETLEKKQKRAFVCGRERRERSQVGPDQIQACRGRW